ncbi:MAG: GTPase Era [Deferribacterales bacterium]|nr:GTPase Era [Deferribacterales bacterium]
MSNNSEKQFRAGLIAFAGLPNAGKSTLLNALVGEKIAIVSPRPQTTRNTIYGIKTEDDYQAILVDTPGFHSAKTRLNRAIVQQAIDSISIVDVICVLVEAGTKIGNDFKRLMEIVKAAPQPKILLVTKIDSIKKEAVYKTAEQVFPMADFSQVLPISSVKDVNLDKFMSLAVEYLPENVPQYDKDLITTQPERFLAAEYIREQAFLNLRQEVPYDVLVEIESFEDTEKRIEISAVIYVSRESQKGIVIGENGSMLKKIGQNARKNLEAFFDCNIHLELWVKVRENWVAHSDYLDIQGLR